MFLTFIHIKSCSVSNERARGTGSKSPTYASFSDLPVSVCAYNKSLLMKLCSNKYRKRPRRGRKLSWESERASMVRLYACLSWPALTPSDTFVVNRTHSHRVAQSVIFGIKESKLFSQLRPSLPYAKDISSWKVSFFYCKIRTKIPSPQSCYED